MGSSSLTAIEPRPLALGAESPSNGTSRKVPASLVYRLERYFIFNPQTCHIKLNN